MKASILLNVSLIASLLLASVGTASAHHGRWHRVCGPVPCERTVVRYVHGRCYHPTPYCSEPVVFRREYSEGPWYYVHARPEPVRYHEEHGEYCRGGHCHHH